MSLDSFFRNESDDILYEFFLDEIRISYDPLKFLIIFEKFKIKASIKFCLFI